MSQRPPNLAKRMECVRFAGALATFSSSSSSSSIDAFFDYEDEEEDEDDLEVESAARAKSEIRNPKSETNPNEGRQKIQNQKPPPMAWQLGLCYFLFEFADCFGFRDSDFGFGAPKAHTLGDIRKRRKICPSARVAGESLTSVLMGVALASLLFLALA